MSMRLGTPLTVKEVMRELAGYPADAEVYFYDGRHMQPVVGVAGHGGTLCPGPDAKRDCASSEDNLFRRDLLALLLTGKAS
jgi:hypothetical protein